VQRGIDQPDDHRITIHRLEQTFEILALIWQQFIQGSGAFLTGLRQDHPLDDRQAFGFKEHVLGAAKPDPDRAIGTRALSIFRIISVCPNLQPFGWPAFRPLADSLCRRNGICPTQQVKQVNLLFKFRSGQV